MSIALLLAAALLPATAQTVSHVTAEQVGKTIRVSYDLDKAADITLFLSTDGGSTYTQLYRVSGDVGKNVSAGHKTIVWDVLAEREKLAGDNIVFKVKAQGEDNLTFTVSGVTFKMIYVQGGTFTMGCTSEQVGDCESDENPAHSVTLSDFYMGETEVTQALWQAVMGSNPSHFTGDNRPVENVSWNDCQAFIQKLNQLTGRTFRLPTEAEWEYAARGGVHHSGYKYAGSNSVGYVAWYNGNSGSQTHDVKTKQPNALGLYDMSGNVWEWCSDWYGSYSSGAQTGPQGPSSGSTRVLRGGSWNRSVGDCRVSDRNGDGPGRGSYYGFRLSIVQ
jgi:formylglycine-generating enzyme required for sulfatase activity